MGESYCSRQRRQFHGMEGVISAHLDPSGCRRFPGYEWVGLCLNPSQCTSRLWISDGVTRRVEGLDITFFDGSNESMWKKEKKGLVSSSRSCTFSAAALKLVKFGLTESPHYAITAAPDDILLQWSVRRTLGSAATLIGRIWERGYVENRQERIRDDGQGQRHRSRAQTW